MRDNHGTSHDRIRPGTMVVANKGLLTLGIMLSTVMQVLDTTIANVALPHMSAALGGVSA